MQSKEKINIYQALCFCGSNKPISDCCFAQINTIPPAPKTGYSHPKCYARSLHDCSTKISREHFISSSILKLFPTKTLTISGTRWLQDGKSQEFTAKGLASNILCQRHNAALSGLDDIAQKFFKVIFGRSKHQWVAVIRGYEIERWMLKLLCGIGFSGNLMNNGIPLPPVEPHPDFLRTLFYAQPIPEGFGLACILEEQDSILSNRIMWRPLIHELAGLMGCEFYFSFMRLVLFIQGPIESIAYIKGTQNGLIYHPSVIVVKQGKEHREVHLGWPSSKAFVIEVNENPTEGTT